MGHPKDDARFAGSIPAMYERYLVPLLFETYAADLVGRLIARSPARVLEVAAGTGVVTRAMAARLPAGVEIVATDLNQAMLDRAASNGIARPVEWRAADGMVLPFGDAEFDAVVCQFGAMFFPDKVRAFAEARRVLRPHGAFLFNVWDRLEDNELAHSVSMALASLFPDDPPQFLARAPYGYHDVETVRRDLAAAGFAGAPEITTLATRSVAASARDPAMGFCEGSPVRGELEARGPTALAAGTEAATRAVALRFGDGRVDAKIQAHVVVVGR